MRSIVEKKTRLATKDEFNVLATHLANSYKEEMNTHPNPRFKIDEDEEIDVYLDYKKEITSLTITDVFFNTGERVCLYTALILMEFNNPMSCENEGKKFTDMKGNYWPTLKLLIYENDLLEEIGEDDQLFCASDETFESVCKKNK